MNPKRQILSVGILLAVVAFMEVAAEAVRLDPVRGGKGMVVAGHPEAVAIGLQVLQDGGNAMDAVVATSLALGVAEPYGSGLGGKCAILYFDSDSGEVVFIDGMDQSGRLFDVEALDRLSSAEQAEGVAAIGVPGLLAALELGHNQYGSLPWDELVLPAADLAERGFRMVPGMEIFFERRLDRIRSHRETARIYLPDGEVPATGSRVANPDLAHTLRLVAEQGGEGFYQGEVARRIVEEVQGEGGHLTLEDFRDYRARMGVPVKVAVAGKVIHAGGPPTTGGATTLLSLKALEPASWNYAAGFHAAENLDIWARILRHVYPRIQATIADCPTSLEAWRTMLDPASLRKLREEAGISAPAENASPVAVLAGDGWTTHFVVADAEGNVASVTQSLSHHFGSGVTAPGTGVVLNNSLKNFSFQDPHGVNYGAPGKRPRSTIAPVIGMEDGKPAFALGLPGGGRIPTTTLAILVDYLYFHSGLGDAIASPRVHLLRSWSDAPDSHILQIEAGLPAGLQGSLRELGWEVREITDSEFFGGMTAVEIAPDGKLTGWADYRRTNQAAGF